MMAAREVHQRPFVRHDESMVSHTSWRVGGAAELYCEPRNTEELREFLRSVPPEMSILWIGYGSNLLVRDGGIRGAVIATGRMARELERISPRQVRAGAGTACARFAKQCAQWALGPAAFMVGIPGTIGGALAMNAGAFGGETWSHVESVETIDRDGVIRERPRADYQIGYRSVTGPEGEWFIAATFRLEPGADQHEDAATIRSMLGRRAASQPLGQASCGSVFRNPPDAAAGELIESCGLKGTRIGGARVSEKHANFIVNDGSATASDIEALIGHVRRCVFDATGIELQPEVRIVGEVDNARQD
ncbi:MAG: UDP-N-acetylmuramate dehydrogenase [Gammaproteobacteria bacterium]|jgi:UDP-N-acetylmuramate dehydrogenase